MKLGFRSRGAVLFIVSLMFVGQALHAEDLPCREILVRQLQMKDSVHHYLVVTDGGYLDGLVTGLTATVQGKDSSGQAVTFLNATIVDVDRYFSWSQVVVDARDSRVAGAGLKQFASMGGCLRFDQPDLPPDTLQQQAIAAMGRADYELAAALLTRLLRHQPEQASARSALDRCLEKLTEFEHQPLDSADAEFVRQFLGLYVERLQRFAAAGHNDTVQYMARCIQSIVPDHKLADSYLEALALAGSFPNANTGAGQPRYIVTDKRSIFPVEFDATLPADVPLTALQGDVGFRLDGNGHIKLRKSSGNDDLDQIAEKRAKKALWQDWASRSCIVDFSHAADSIVLVYGPTLDTSEIEGPAHAWLRGSSGIGNEAFVFTEQPTILYMPPVTILEPDGDPDSHRSPVFLNLLIDSDGKVERTLTVKSSGHKAADEAILEAVQKARFASGAVDGSAERYWVGLVFLPSR